MIILNSLKHAFILSILASPISSTLSATSSHDTDFEALLGYDSNALRISTNEQDGFFSEFDLDYEYLYIFEGKHKFSIDVDVNTRIYEDTLTDANKTVGKLASTFQWAEAKTPFGKLRPEVSIDLNGLDRTYTSRNTGNVATFGGQDIGDRYDSLWFDFNAGLRNRLDKLNLYLDFDARIKDYQNDYQALGLERLDYYQYGLTPRLRYRFNDSLVARLKLQYQRRNYKDRRQRDLNGAALTGTDLSYNHYSLDSSISYELSDEWKIRLAGGLFKRHDNGSGYTDKTEYSSSAKLSYFPTQENEYSAKIEYFKREFDNGIIDPNGFNEENRAKEGWRVKLESETEISISNLKSLFLILELSYERFDETPAFLAYDRFQGTIGLKKEF